MRAIPRPSLRSRSRALAFLPLVVCGVLTSGCFGLRARAVTAPTPLDMPEPPPRVVEVHEPDVPPPIPLPEEPVRNTPTRPRPTPPPIETARPAQTAPPETPADPAKPEELTPRPPTTLQTTPTQREEEVERRIRGLLGQAMAELSRINYQNLSSDGRTQYDIAKRFVSQAEEALKAKNLPFANNLADKAATLATQLTGR
jgi:outer membrane biosynthesis protein TonB